MKRWLWLPFVLGTVLAWGTYVPMIHEGQKEIGGSPKAGALRAFLCVGAAYCVTAVLIPLGLFAMGPKATGGERLVLNSRKGLTYAFIAGCLGAAGALGIVLSLKYGGSPVYVPPLVFAGAPIMNALVSLAWHPPKIKPGGLFYVGIVLAALGAGLVLYSKADAASKAKKAAAAAKKAAEDAAVAAAKLQLEAEAAAKKASEEAAAKAEKERLEAEAAAAE